jgi:hypothetical protein
MNINSLGGRIIEKYKLYLASAKIRLRELFDAASQNGASAPIFIVGCGRSGTTILGTTLAQNCQITLLNERRDLWISAYPQTDVWAPQAAARGSKIILKRTDATAEQNRRLRRTFRFELAKSRKSILLEKLPINSFRLDFIESIFPEARFIHIHRNGIDVARSIERFCVRRQWYGCDGYKWEQLRQVAELRATTRELPSLCKGNFEKALLEWRLSTEEVVRFFTRISASRWVEISYDDLVDDPVASIQRVLAFIGASSDPAVIAFAEQHIARRTTRSKLTALSDRERILGGPLLPISVSGVSELTRHASGLV